MFSGLVYGCDCAAGHDLLSVSESVRRECLHARSIPLPLGFEAHPERVGNLGKNMDRMNKTDRVPVFPTPHILTTENSSGWLVVSPGRALLLLYAENRDPFWVFEPGAVYPCIPVSPTDPLSKDC